MNQLDWEIRIQIFGIPIVVITSIVALDKLTQNSAFSFFNQPAPNSFTMPLLAFVFFIFVNRAVDLVLGKIWNTLSPIDSDNVIETFLVRWLCYSISVSVIGLILLNHTILQFRDQFPWILFAIVPAAILGTIMTYRIKSGIEKTNSTKYTKPAKINWVPDRAFIIPSLLFAGGCAALLLVPALFMQQFEISVLVRTILGIFVVSFVSILLLSLSMINWGAKITGRITKLNNANWPFHSLSFFLGVLAWWLGVKALIFVLRLGSNSESIAQTPRLGSLIVEIAFLILLVVSSFVHGWIKQKQINQNIDGIFD